MPRGGVDQFVNDRKFAAMQISTTAFPFPLEYGHQFIIGF